jgi:RND family efflux transporter MFP subunit
MGPDAPIDGAHAHPDNGPDNATNFIPRVAPMSRHARFFAALTLATLVAGCRPEAHHEEEPPPEAPVKAQPAAMVSLGEWTDLLGTTQPLPNHSARISAAVEGHVLTVLRDEHGGTVVEGQDVKAGQVIVQMDDSVLRANRTKLEATLHDLDQQETQARLAVKVATIEANALKELQKGGTPVSPVDLDKAQLKQEDADSKLKAAKAKQAATRADLKALEKQMEFYTLRAPIAGRLSMVQAVPGQTLTPGTVVADVVDLKSIDVLCYAPPDAVARLSLEQRARLLVEDAGKRDATQALAGTVAFVGVAAQPETGNVPVKVRFPNPELRLRANAIVRIHVLTRPEKQRLTIPDSALSEDRDVPTVLIIEDLKTTKDDHGEEKQVGKAHTLQAEIGIRDREHGIVELLALRDPESHKEVSPDGRLFITSGGNGLHNDDLVKLQKDEHKEKD